MSLMDGPNLPRAMNFPCIVEINSLNLIFVMGNSNQSQETLFSYIYFVANDTWTDINYDANLPKRIMTEAPSFYSCAMLNSNGIVISVMSSDKSIYTALFNVETFTWSSIDNTKIKAGNGNSVTLLRSEEKTFVTLLASQNTSNHTKIYQVNT